MQFVAKLKTKLKSLSNSRSIRKFFYIRRNVRRRSCCYSSRAVERLVREGVPTEIVGPGATHRWYVGQTRWRLGQGSRKYLHLRLIWFHFRSIKCDQLWLTNNLFADWSSRSTKTSDRWNATKQWVYDNSTITRVRAPAANPWGIIHSIIIQAVHLNLAIEMFFFSTGIWRRREYGNVDTRAYGVFGHVHSYRATTICWNVTFACWFDHSGVWR